VITRQLIAISLICFLSIVARGQNQAALAFGVEDCTIERYGITDGHPVSFTIGFPKGWKKSVERAPVPVLCSFWSMPVQPDGPQITSFALADPQQRKTRSDMRHP
jgi:hypothetical protein